MGLQRFGNGQRNDRKLLHLFLRLLLLLAPPPTPPVYLLSAVVIDFIVTCHRLLHETCGVHEMHSNMDTERGWGVYLVGKQSVGKQELVSAACRSWFRFRFRVSTGGLTFADATKIGDSATWTQGVCKGSFIFLYLFLILFFRLFFWSFSFQSRRKTLRLYFLFFCFIYFNSFFFLLN